MTKISVVFEDGCIETDDWGMSDLYWYDVNGCTEHHSNVANVKYA